MSDPVDASTEILWDQVMDRDRRIRVLEAEVKRLRKTLQEITEAGWDGDWAAEHAREALETVD
jgi:hypothetical protein